MSVYTQQVMCMYMYACYVGYNGVERQRCYGYIFQEIIIAMRIMFVYRTPIPMVLLSTSHSSVSVVNFARSNTCL